ncbi:MAG: RNA polymerase sigma factor [Gammaproteobacteria bacterium]|nr:RNA polymerase sigma factor [Gammaproteobacteria bacterium]MXY56189.1 RNA polymerase sigma factor [Gammaproteobacteria bacterium]MYF29045.1 RNA polymerase sigma factor [Gammaproteobacteria bacterium]MYK45824.1 RNA polymerase sigma factor [Gammaproteobacteria bacterium]
MAESIERGAGKGKALSGVSRAFVENHSSIKSFLGRLLTRREDIEDIAQEAYLRAYVAEQSRRIDQPEAYLYRSARNLALTKLTQKSRQMTDLIDDLGPAVVLEGDTPLEEQVAAEESLGLHCEAVAHLPEKCKQVYILRKVYGLTHKEIAERMSLSVSSVEKYMLKGVLACRAYVERREGASRKSPSVLRSLVGQERRR